MTTEPNMIKLTTTHLTILAAAAGREDGFAMRPDTLRPTAAAKIASKLLENGLVRELRAKGDMPVWREDEHGKAFSLKILKAGREAVLAMAPPPAEAQGSGLGEAAGNSDAGSANAIRQSSALPKAGAAKPGSKRAVILALLSREHGASVQALMEATGWLPHTTRAALSGLRKGGLAIARSTDGKGGASVYRIDSAAIAAAA